MSATSSLLQLWILGLELSVENRLAHHGQRPLQVANKFKRIGSIGTSFCGGALICDSWVLTAAHCALEVTHITLYLGLVNQSQVDETGRVELETTEKIVHEGYFPFILNHDIALIKLQQKVTFTDRIQPIPLGDGYTGANVTLTASGWGKQVIASCSYIHIFLGDSGGPLVQKRPDGKVVHVGVVSFVHTAGCASGNLSGYVRTESYRDWIVKNINGTCKLP